MKPPTKYLSKIGKIGGAKGGAVNGSSKVRGDSNYYRTMAAKRKDRKK